MIISMLDIVDYNEITHNDTDTNHNHEHGS